MKARYLSAEAIWRLNQRVLQDTEEPIFIRDEAGLKSAAGRPTHTDDGIDLVPDIVDKASLYLHALASTQVFGNGNKRTAWAATELFLSLNGVGIRNVPIVAQEALLVATAIREAKDFDETKVSEWLREHILTASDRVDFAVLAIPHGIKTLTHKWAFELPVQGITLNDGNMIAFVSVSARLHWFEIDRGTTKTVSVRLREIPEPPYVIDPISKTAFAGEVVSHWESPIFPNGFQAWNEDFILKLNVLSPGQNYVDLLIDGEVAWSETLTINQQISIPHSLP